MSDCSYVQDLVLVLNRQKMEKTLEGPLMEKGTKTSTVASMDVHVCACLSLR